MPYVENKEVRIYYETRGSGPPLLLISGLSGGCWSWFGQIPYFEKDFRVITLDNRGAGRSSMAPGPYVMQDFAEDILALLDHLRIRSAFLLGISMGGMIAQELALLAPHRVPAMVLACTHCGGKVKRLPKPEVLEALIHNEGLSREKILRKNLPLFFSGTFLEKNPTEIDRYCEVHLRAPSQKHWAFEAQLRAIANHDVHHRLEEIKSPAMIVTGTHDLLVPPENSHHLHEHIKGSKLVECPGAGHALHVECRDELNEIASRFFRDH